MKLRNLASMKWIYRAWYYFRQGYSTYLAVKNMPPLLHLFPHFTPFALLATVVGIPLAIILGWVHMKRSGVYSSE